MVNLLENFIKSFDFDKKLAIYDIEGSIAHTKSLSKSKIISKKDAEKIISGLKKIRKKILSGEELPPTEDIHYAIENELTKTIGKEIAGKLHTGRSRNDQIVLDMKLFLKDEIKKIVNSINKLQKTILEKAKENIDVIMPGYTHLQPAQPVLFSHWILSYCWMFQRDKERFNDCYKRTDELPLGSAAFAGTSFPIDRKSLAKLLGFSRISENSVDAVSDRDFIIEFLSCCAITQVHLSRLSEEIIIWLNPQFNFVSISKKFTSGSSIMPQKRNPDAFELIRGKTGKIYGALLNILTVMKALPLSYNRDLQEDKPPMFDATETLKSSIEIMSEMLKTLKVNKEKMKSVSEKNYIYATELADYLTRKKLPFRKAHSIVKKIVSDCMKKNKEIKELTLSQLKEYSNYFQKDIYKCLDPKYIINTKKTYGSTSLKSVKTQIKKLGTLIFVLFIFFYTGEKILSQEQKPERIFTIEDSISCALNNRKEILIIEKELEIARERVKEANSFLYPKIDLTFNYSKLNTDQWMSLPPTFSSILLQRSSPGDYYLTRLSLWQHVYSGGRYSSNLKLAETNLTRAENQKKIIINDITLQVKKSIYELLAIEKKIETYNVVISSVEKIIEISKIKNTEQRLQNEKILNKMKNEKTINEFEYEKKKIDFLNILGLELNTSFKLNVKFEPVKDSYDINNLLAWAFQYRPEPKQIQAQEEMDTLSVKLSLATRYPTVSLGAHYDFSGEDLSFDKKNWNATLNLNVPIFDGWASWSRIKQKKLQVEQNKLRKKDMEDNIRLQVRKSYIEYNFWLKEFIEREKQLKDAENILTENNSSLQAWQHYLECKINYITALKELLSSRTSIEHAIGKSLEIE